VTARYLLLHSMRALRSFLCLIDGFQHYSHLLTKILREFNLMLPDEESHLNLSFSSINQTTTFNFKQKKKLSFFFIKPLKNANGNILVELLCNFPGVVMSWEL
jgi:hypothetical protein